MSVEARVTVQLSGTPQFGWFRTHHLFLLILLNMLSNFPSSSVLW